MSVAQRWAQRNHPYWDERFAVEPAEPHGIRPGHELTVERRLDGSMHYRFNNRYLELELVQDLPKAKPLNRRPSKAKAPPPPQPPKPRSPLPKPALIARLRSTPAASRPALSTPSASGDR